MAWPATAVVTNDPVTAAQLNGLPVLIANTTLGANAASIDFTSIPQHYAHLRIECYLRGDAAFSNRMGWVRLNGDATSQYDSQELYAGAATPVSLEWITSAFIIIGRLAASTAAANLFSAHKLTIPHYANSANNKALISRSSMKTGTTTGLLQTAMSGGFWRSNAAITRVTILPQSGNLVSGSRATLWGWP